MKILITGASGFVGPYLYRSLQETLGPQAQIVASSRRRRSHSVLGTVESLDVTDTDAIADAIAKINPTHVIHLAGVAAIPTAMANTKATWEIHLSGTLNIANAIIRSAPNCVLIYVGSGQIYGASARSGEMLSESTLLEPTNVYTASKAAADLALGALTGSGLRCIRFRPFNHTGKGQSEDFVIPSFAKQIAHVKLGKRAPELNVGNLEVERDFLDVRDVVSAYSKAVALSDTIPSGVILNIASGVPYRIRNVLDRLISISGIKIAIRTDSARLRPGEIVRFVGDATLARQILDWCPMYLFEDTLREIYEHAVQEARNEA